ncbi:MAG TPA: hypothetical protein VFG59_09840 [Anaeromyxobacter sp.]|nr:hypothetical protein [Anaeromyxobacter sp.]
MRFPVALLIGAALAMNGCHNACEELADRLCNCRPEGTTKASCTDAIKVDIQRVNPSKSEQSTCSHLLDTCGAPSTVDFCDFIQGRCGKAACGLSNEDYETLLNTPADPNDPTGPTVCQK